MQATVVVADLQVHIESISVSSLIFPTCRLILEPDELNALFIDFLDALEAIEHVLLTGITEAVLIHRILNVIQNRYRPARQILGTGAHS